MPPKRKERSDEIISISNFNERESARKKRQYETRSQGLMKKAHELALLTESVVHIYISVPGMLGKYQVFLSDLEDKGQTASLQLKLSPDQIYGEIKGPNDFLTVKQRVAIDLDLNPLRRADSREQDSENGEPLGRFQGEVEVFKEQKRLEEIIRTYHEDQREPQIKSEDPGEVFDCTQRRQAPQLSEEKQGNEIKRSVNLAKLETADDIRLDHIDMQIPFTKQHYMPTLDFNVK
ncbi:hypothetical protein TWF594_007857 [Orbilia oligospora]|nr:hypothetical protein TWF594_007857 [Orbilia oligospora]